MPPALWWKRPKSGWNRSWTKWTCSLGTCRIVQECSVPDFHVQIFGMPLKLLILHCFKTWTLNYRHGMLCSIHDIPWPKLPYCKNVFGFHGWSFCRTITSQNPEGGVRPGRAKNVPWISLNKCFTKTILRSYHPGYSLEYFLGAWAMPHTRQVTR